MKWYSKILVREKIASYIYRVDHYSKNCDVILKEEARRIEEMAIRLQELYRIANEKKIENKSIDNSGIKYSISPSSNDKYDAISIHMLMKKVETEENISKMLKALEMNVNPSFVDVMLYYISKKGYRDSAVYKAAHVDKRLFSKMVSNREYKPAKDTAIAIAFALKLQYLEAIDLLNRAGYTLSHSNKRDIIIEYFFREEIYNLIDINCVLFRLGEKIIGRE